MSAYIELHALAAVQFGGDALLLQTRLPGRLLQRAGANRGVTQALSTITAERRPIFVGHELTAHTRAMLESGIMDYAISHDFVGEMTAAVRWIRGAVEGARTAPPITQILVHTRYNCEE